jgi:fibronectin type 3 domain-containing protein
VPSPPALNADARNGRPRLIWFDRKSPRWSHYNLYSSNHPGFACDRSTIIASPDAPEYVDWRAPAGPNYYKVTQVTLDGLESAPSNEMAVAR